MATTIAITTTLRCNDDGEIAGGGDDPVKMITAWGRKFGRELWKRVAPSGAILIGDEVNYDKGVGHITKLPEMRPHVTLY